MGVCSSASKAHVCMFVGLFMLSTLSSNTPHTKQGVAVNKHACMWECVRMHVRLVCMCDVVCLCMQMCVLLCMWIIYVCLRVCLHASMIL